MIKAGSKKIKIMVLAMVYLTALFFFTFKLLSVPPGLETDEGSIAYNSVLISQNLRDENGRLLPFFILSCKGTDWKQPTLIYLSAIFFRLLGKSLLVFKLINPIIMLVGVSLMGLTLNKLFGSLKLTAMGMILFICTPILIITTRLMNESALAGFFSSAWFWALLSYREKQQQKKFLVLAALALGIGFYSFKGMRILVPVWGILSLFFIAWKNEYRFKSKEMWQDLFSFGLTALPFAAAAPFLELKYPGAVFDHQVVHLESYRFYFYYWLANLDFSFWFGKPDVGKIYFTDMYGPFLLASLPLFLTGVWESVRRRGIFLFSLICFATTPMLMGLAKSTDYSHRLVGMVPFFIVLVVLGLKKLTESNRVSKIVLGGVLLLLLINIFDFGHFYYFRYPKLDSTKKAFGNQLHDAFYLLSQEEYKSGGEVYVQDDIWQNRGDANRFFEKAYFEKPIKGWIRGSKIPSGSVLLTEMEQAEGFTKIASHNNLYIHKAD